MERNKAIYFWSNLLFLILLSLFFISGIFLDIIKDDSVWLLVLIPGIIYVIFFLIILFKVDFSKRFNLTSITFNWLSLLFLFLWFRLVLSANNYNAFGNGFALIFIVWPALVVLTLISWIASLIFYYKHHFVNKK